MIIVNLKGGLGNQLFQYAAGKALAMRNNTELKFDTSLLNADPKNEYTKRNFELDAFNVSLSIATAKELDLFSKKTFLKKVIFKISPALLPKYYLANEKGFEYDTGFNILPKNTYLNGYWQSEKYFYLIRETLLNELKIKKAKTEKVIEAEKKIVNSVSVSLHIRRGDYVTNKKSAEFHGLLPLEYYYKALELIKEKYSDISIFVFSDDIPWTKNNLNLSNKCEYIDFNTGEDSVFDMYLMSLCKHNIIANSSFSWWGAWLNQNSNKMVIAPKKWFVQDNLNTKDVIPESWIKI